MLSGDNSILQKATEAKQTSERAEAKEQAQMDIMAYIADKTANHQDASLDDSKVKDILTDKSYVKEAKESSFITAKGDYEILYSELYTATDRTPSDPAPSAINYGSKTESNVGKGDTIEITFGEGTETYVEQFMVLNNENNEIMAIPYYNISPSTTDPVQISSFDYYDQWTFNGSGTWSGAGVNANMNGGFQQVISAYSNKISNATNGRATAEIGRWYDDDISTGWNISGYLGQTNSESKKLLNPSGIGAYWIGSSDQSNANRILDIDTGDNAWANSPATMCGIRPIIKITI